MCVDSLEIFKKIDEQSSNICTDKITSEANTVENVSKITTNICCSGVLPLEQIQTVSSSNVELRAKEVKQVFINDISEINSEVIYSTNLFDSLTDELLNNAMTNWQSINETTPSTSVINKHKSHHHKARDHSATQPRKLAKRKLFGEHNHTVKKTYKLVDIYQRQYQRAPPASHFAEADTLTLLKCVMSMRDDFIKLCEIEAKPISEIKEL